MQRALVRPSIERLPALLRGAAREIAEVLAHAGHRAWIVGGAVRDLALERAPGEIDLCSAARPEELERLFEHTVAVGRHFGTIVVQHAGLDVQVTTFRSDGAYSDARRPDQVAFGQDLEEDARRRDFTCNALYLDPRTDELQDPCGGLADLAAGRLCCVGEPAARFAEDGLRLLRLARFAAAFELEVEPATLAAARTNADRIAGVSPERVLAELGRVAEGAAPGRALELLARLGVLGRILPVEGGEAEVLAAASRLGDAPGLASLLAVLLGPLADADPARALASAERLRPPRELLRRLEALWSIGASLERLIERGEEATRAERIRVLREPACAEALRVHRARFPGPAERARGREALATFGSSLPRSELFPSPLLTSADLADAGVGAGPGWGAILREAEERRLDGRDASREEALAWLRERARGPQDGGNARRKRKLSG